MVAACDKEILGKRFTEGELQLEVREEFYKGGKTVKTEKLIEEISNATIVNLAGNKTVEAAVKHKLVVKENVLTIGGVKHAQIIAII